MAMVLFKKLPLYCVIFALSAAVCSAAHSAPAPAVDCSSLVLNMADCLSFVMAGSTTSKPEGTCCSGLKTVLKTGAECLCEAFKNSAQLGVTLNVSKALSLPAACHVSAPSVTNCGSLSPLAVSPSSVAGTPSAAIGADEVAPSPAPALGSSGSSSLAATSFELLVLTAMAAVFFTSFY
ncbi:hypothetical protein DH2020_024066 [Rehmannia glutinosa]|uniref:Bifunctional inhibitor/plant lipid transfer protein/seed storage helical domain-containing protein n=1 Tax=Rehmannia glutinosa TaxID=99300 RepID=A0ABR0WA37_REHGL